MSAISRRAAISSVLAAPLALFALEEKSRFEKTYPANVGGVDVDIVNGDLKIRAGARTDIRVIADIEIKTQIPEDLTLAKREVRFEPRVEENLLRVWVETPQDRRWNRYSFRHNVEIEVPSGLRLIARTVNGKVGVRFDAAPRKDVYIKNVNGEIDLEFAEPLNADCRLMTRNGTIYSAFDFSPLAQEEKPVVTDNGMRRIVSRNRYAGGRAGRGGPEIRVEGMNGDIRLRERKA